MATNRRKVSKSNAGKPGANAEKKAPPVPGQNPVSGGDCTRNHTGQKMTSKQHDFNALLVMPSRDKINNYMLDVWGEAFRVCPKWRVLAGREHVVEWLYNYRPELARAIERQHKLYPDDGAA